jgi:hypothetical protein
LVLTPEKNGEAHAKEKDGDAIDPTRHKYEHSADTDGSLVDPAL